MSLCVPSVLGVADGGLGRLQNCICRWYQGEKKNSYFTQGEKIRGSDNQWQLFASGIFLIFILFFLQLTWITQLACNFIARPFSRGKLCF